MLDFKSAPTGGEIRCGVLETEGSYTVDIDDVQAEVCGGATFPQ